MKITVVGLGHLGMVAACGLAHEGHRVTGLDIDKPRVAELRKGEISLFEPGLEEWLNEGVQNGDLRFLHMEEFTGALGDVALIATGTPASEGGEADLCQVHSALHWIKSLQPGNTAIVMKSSVPPGSGRAFMQRELKGLDIAYVANPEFLREGRALQDWMYPDRIVVGTDDCSRAAIDIIRDMYSSIEAPYLVTDTTSAEMLKYASNAFLATRISFINEVAALCETVGASIDTVSQGLAMDARMGQEIHAGIGYGGSCFPKDILALQYLAESKGMQTDLMRSVTTVNAHQRMLPLARLRSRFCGDLVGVKVAVLGLSFKPGTNDIREAASLNLIDALVAEGAEVRAFDPQANNLARRVLPSCVDFVDSPESATWRTQALLLLTEWPEIVDADWAAIATQMLAPKFVFDGRNALDAKNMVKLGFEYTGVGRGHVNRLANGRDTLPKQPVSLLPIT